MKLLKKIIHPDLKTIENKTIFKRPTARAIALKKNNILLLHTERYNDYSLPGGGLDKGEDFVTGMIRELKEETGASNVADIRPFGIYEEYRPWYKPDFDIQHIISYCYTCSVDEKLGDTEHEHYETENGMTPLWIDIHSAIAHNQNTMKSSHKKGMSIERETFLLQHIVEELLS